MCSELRQRRLGLALTFKGCGGLSAFLTQGHFKLTAGALGQNPPCAEEQLGPTSQDRVTSLSEEEGKGCGQGIKGLPEWLTEHSFFPRAQVRRCFLMLIHETIHLWGVLLLVLRDVIQTLRGQSQECLGTGS